MKGRGGSIGIHSSFLPQGSQTGTNSTALDGLLINAAVADFFRTIVTSATAGVDVAYPARLL